MPEEQRQDAPFRRALPLMWLGASTRNAYCSCGKLANHFCTPQLWFQAADRYDQYSVLARVGEPPDSGKNHKERGGSSFCLCQSVLPPSFTSIIP